MNEYKYDNKFDVKLFQGKKSSTTNSSNTFAII